MAVRLAAEENAARFPFPYDLVVNDGEGPVERSVVYWNIEDPGGEANKVKEADEHHEATADENGNPGEHRGEVQACAPKLCGKGPRLRPPYARAIDP